jgi:hypothetical protein
MFLVKTHNELNIKRFVFFSKNEKCHYGSFAVNKYAIMTVANNIGRNVAKIGQNVAFVMIVWKM